VLRCEQAMARRNFLLYCKCPCLLASVFDTSTARLGGRCGPAPLAEAECNFASCESHRVLPGGRRLFFFFLAILCPKRFGPVETCRCVSVKDRNGSTRPAATTWGPPPVVQRRQQPPESPAPHIPPPPPVADNGGRGPMRPTRQSGVAHDIGKWRLRCMWPFAEAWRVTDGTRQGCRARRRPLGGQTLEPISPRET